MQLFVTEFLYSNRHSKHILLLLKNKTKRKKNIYAIVDLMASLLLFPVLYSDEKEIHSTFLNYSNNLILTVIHSRHIAILHFFIYKFPSSLLLFLLLHVVAVARLFTVWISHFSCKIYAYIFSLCVFSLFDALNIIVSCCILLNISKHEIVFSFMYFSFVLWWCLKCKTNFQ